MTDTFIDHCLKTILFCHLGEGQELEMVRKALQAGVDVFTLAKWVGHRDNGKLLLKVYSHLQAEHSQEQARKVTFGTSTAASAPAKCPHTALPTSDAQAV